MAKNPNTIVNDVLPAAMSLVASNGLRALTLRPLAEKLQTTVSALTYRFGRKEDLLAHLIRIAIEEDRAFFDVWIERFEGLSIIGCDLLADLADTVLDDMARQQNLRTQFYCELLQASASRPDIATPLAEWQALRLQFWQSLTILAQTPDLGPILHAYVTDEMAHGLALGDNAAYRWLRRLNLRRLCTGLMPDTLADGELFGVFHASLGNMVGTADGRYQVTDMTPWQTSVAGHISALIVAEGADAITHRAVAERADVPSSTLAYHFPRQEDLLKAGLEHIISRLQANVASLPPLAQPVDAGQSSREIARATFAIALAATRMEGLRGFAADMRRRRGENLHAHMNRDAGANRRLDLLAAQALSMTGIGQVILSGADGSSHETGTVIIGKMIHAATERTKTS